MKSNYVIQAEINIAKHPEWNIEEKFIELKYAYEKEGFRCRLIENKMFLIPTKTAHDIKGLRAHSFIINEGNM